MKICVFWIWGDVGFRHDFPTFSMLILAARSWTAPRIAMACAKRWRLAITCCEVIGLPYEIGRLKTPVIHPFFLGPVFLVLLRSMAMTWKTSRSVLCAGARRVKLFVEVLGRTVVKSGIFFEIVGVKSESWNDSKMIYYISIKSPRWKQRIRVLAFWDLLFGAWWNRLQDERSVYFQLV